MKIISVIIIVIFFLQLIACGFIGWKKGFFKGALALASNIIATFVALFIAKFVGKALNNVLGKTISNIIGSPFENMGDTLDISGLFNNLVLSLTGAIIAAVTFAVIYLILYFLMKIPVHIVNKKLSEKEAIKNLNEKAHPYSPILCVLSGLLSAIIVLSPVAVPVASINKAFVNSEEGTNYKIYKDIKPLANNFVLGFTAAAGGNFFVNTVSNTGGKTLSFTREVNSIASVAVKVLGMGGNDGDISKIGSAFEDTDNIIELASDSELMTDFFLTVYSSDNSGKTLSDFAYNGISSALKSMDINISTKELNVNLDNLTKAEIRAEAELISSTVNKIQKYTHTSVSKLSSDDVYDIVDTVAEFKNSVLFSGYVESVADEILASYPTADENLKNYINKTLYN